MHFQCYQNYRNSIMSFEVLICQVIVTCLKKLCVRVRGSFQSITEGFVILFGHLKTKKKKKTEQLLDLKRLRHLSLC